MKLTSALASALVAVSSAVADWQFRSRPDLAPPRLNISIPANGGGGDKTTAPGYLFVAPHGNTPGTPEQPAGYILRDDGDLVWSSLGYLSGWVANFHVARYGGQNVLQAFQGSFDSTHGRGWGSPVLLDQHYRPVAQVQSVAGKVPSIHELRIVDEKSMLLEIYQPRPYNLTPFGGTGEQQWIVDAIFQEVDIETGELLFEWRSLDFVSPEGKLFGHCMYAFTHRQKQTLTFDLDAVLPVLSSGLTARDAWDYFHLNSIDKDSQGNYLVSARHTNTIYKISGLDGAIIWRLGGPKSTFVLDEGGDEAPFAFQHDVRFLSRSADGSIEVITLFDNAAAITPNGVVQVRPESRALVVQLNHTDNTAVALRVLEAPEPLSSKSQGNVQVLDGGNVFVNWGQAGAVTEFAADGTPVYHAYLDQEAGVENYRGFRFEWKGFPLEKPAIVALRRRSDEAITIYVSWNGDTEVDRWVFYAASHDDRRSKVNAKKLGEAKRRSFETKLTVVDSDELGSSRRVLVFAEGLDKNGNVLTTTDAVGVEDDVEPVDDDRSSEGVSGDGQL